MKIYELNDSGFSGNKIASILGRNKGTISRELSRNAVCAGRYLPDTAQCLTEKRRQRKTRLEQDEALQNYIKAKLCEHYWTPEQIAASLKYSQTALPSVSHESIYKWIYSPTQKKEKLWKFLTRHKAKRGLRKSKGAGRSRIPNRISIHSRPANVENLRFAGHWEGDLMSFRKNSQHILVLRERKTMYTLSTRLESKKAVEIAKKLKKLMKDLPPEARRTLTLDNGGEFAAHEEWMRELNLPSYFCDPYASWQKGGVENTNGRLRRDLPRSTNIHELDEEDFDETIYNYNTTPRKSLGWMTPLEAFKKFLPTVALQT